MRFPRLPVARRGGSAAGDITTKRCNEVFGEYPGNGQPLNLPGGRIVRSARFFWAVENKEQAELVPKSETDHCDETPRCPFRANQACLRGDKP